MRKGQGQGPDCKPLDGASDGPCTATWGDPNATICPGCSGPAMWYWVNFIKEATAAEGGLPSALVSAANLDAELVGSRWSDLDGATRLALLSGSYNHYAQRYFGETLRKLKQLRPKAQWGIWSYPKVARPSIDQWIDYRPYIPGCDSYGPNANSGPCPPANVPFAVGSFWVIDCFPTVALTRSLSRGGQTSRAPTAPCLKPLTTG